jgi:hypothetical protein
MVEKSTIVFHGTSGFGGGATAVGGGSGGGGFGASVVGGGFGATGGGVSSPHATIKVAEAMNETQRCRGWNAPCAELVIMRSTLQRSAVSRQLSLIADR